MQSYKNWNFRCVPIFKEEIVGNNLNKDHFPSIGAFQQQNIYSSELRQLIANYINFCPCIVATTNKRQNPYQDNFELELAYFTDGEVIFNNFLPHYMLQDNFAIPELWLSLIKRRNFELNPFNLNYELLSDPTLNVFKTLEETFDEEASIKKAMYYQM